MSKKSEGAASARLVTTMAIAGGVFLLRKGLAAAWTKATGKVPPTDLTDPKVTLPEALVWAVATGIDRGNGAVLHRALDDAQVVPARSGSADVSQWLTRPASQPLGWSPLTGDPDTAARVNGALPSAGNGNRPRGRHARGDRPSGGALAADQLAVSLLGKLAAVVHKEAARAGELVRLPRYHPEREFLVGQVGTGKLKALRGVVRVKVDRGRRLVHPAGLQLLQAVLAQVVIGLARAVVVGSHV